MAETFPIMFTVPVDVLESPTALDATPPNKFAVTVQDCPDVKLEVITAKAALFPETTPAPVQVNVIPLVGTNVPPVVTFVVVPFLTLNTVGLVSIVTVNVFAHTSSAAVGNAPVLQMAVFDQLPEEIAQTFAMAQSPFASMNA